jgi:hypothetical protein
MRDSCYTFFVSKVRPTVLSGRPLKIEESANTKFSEDYSMFKRKRAPSSLKWSAAVFALVSFGSGELQAAAVVGQWSQNPGTTNWTHSDFSSFYTAAFVTGGHTINPAGSTGEVTLSNLNNFTHFVLNTSSSAGAAAAVQSSNFSSLGTWVNGGGIAIVFLNGTNDAAANALGNSILAAAGSSITASGGTIGFPGFDTNGSLTSLAGADIAGRPLTFMQPNRVSGGSLLAQDMIPNADSNLGAALRVENVGMGKVYVLGEHFENRWFIQQGNGNANLQLFLNMLAQGQLQSSGAPPLGGGGDPFSENPEPGTLLLTAAALAGVAYWRHRRLS